MTAAIRILSAVIFAALLYNGLRMFQQNSNRPERFLRWLRSNPLPHFSGKVRFVPTPRMARLCVVSCAIGAVLILLPPVWCAPIAAASAYFVMLLANLLLTPLEKAITAWYIRDARRILSEHDGLIVVGITGSFGKTSTKNYLYRLLSERYNVLMTPGNFNTLLGVVRTVREQLRPEHQVFIVEMGAKQCGDILEICNLVHPTVGIVTAVGEMHLETFGTLANIQKTKFELIQSLPAGSGYAVYDMDSEGIASYKDIPTHCHSAAYGIEAHRADWRAGSLVYTPEGASFDLIGPGEPLHIRTHLLGDGNILDLCAAVIVARHLGVPDSGIRTAAAKIRSVEHRMSISARGGVTIIDDAYNSNPTGAAMAVKVLSELRIPEGGRRIVITPGFVEMGARQQEACREFGQRIAAAGTDLLVIVNRVNREAILSGATAGGLEAVICADTLREAVAAAGLRPGDAVLYENDLPDTFR